MAQVQIAQVQIAQANNAGSEIWDPIEPVNRYFFEVNRFLDEFILKPTSAWYGLLPQGVRTSTGNFLGNLRTPWTVANDGLQGEGTRAGTAVARFFINTIIGFFGVFDPAKEMGFAPHDEDAVQTLGSWGVQEGPYLMLPVLGSSRYTTFGFAISATVTLSLRLLPPEYVPASLSAYGTSDIRLSMSARRLV